MAIKVNTGEQGTYEIIDDNGKLQNSSALTVSHPSANETAVTVKTSTSPMQGTDFGFTSGGQNTPGIQSTIDKFPFAISGGTATDVGNLSQGRYYVSGNSSKTDGFTAGGQNPSLSPVTTTQIDKFSFRISGGTATDVGDLLDPKNFASSASSRDDAFILGGTPGSPVSIQKFPFAISGGTAIDVGDLSIVVSEGTGHASLFDGFNSGGASGSYPYSTTIDKFPFAIFGGTATDVGDLNLNRIGGAGQSSTTDGFNSGGAYWAPPFTITTQIDKFPFSISAGTATDVGDLAGPNNKYLIAGQSSTTDGFTSGGQGGFGSPPYADINKFPFSISAGTATDVGDLSTDRYNSTGHQN